jgi:hypothetical protein
MVHNPKWLQVIFYSAVALFPCLSAYMFYLAFEAYLEFSNIANVAPFLFLGFGVLYISYIGIKLSKFIPAKVTHTTEGFTVLLSGNTNSYLWSDIAKVKNHNSSQILRLFDSSGSTIYVVDHMTPGYTEFAKKVDEHIGI